MFWKKAFLSIAALLWALTGAVHWGTAMAMSVLMIGGALWITLRAPKPDTPATDTAPFHGFGPFGWMLLGMMSIAAISMIPLPLAVIDLLSPAAADLYRNAWELAGIDRGWGYLTASLGDTAYALWGLVGSFGAYLFALRYGAKRENDRFVVHLIGAAGILFAALLAMRYTGHAISFGATGARSAWHVGLPVNENHLAGVFVAMSLIALGNVFAQRHHHVVGRRAFWALLYAAFGICIVLLRSRGALLGWGVGHAVLFAVMFARSREIPRQAAAIMLVGGTVILAAVLYVSAPTIGAIRQEVAETNWTYDEGEPIRAGQASKTWMYPDFVRMARDWWPAGTGRSAFGDVYPAYQGFPFDKHFRHAENEFAEILLEYGAIWGTLLLLLGAMGLVQFFRTYAGAKDEQTGTVALIAVICALLVQNFFDFSLRYWTTGFVFWIACGILESRRNRWKYGRIEADTTPLSRRQKVASRIGYAVWALSIAAAVAAIPDALDGVTESGVTKLRTALSQGAQTDESRRAIAANMRNRAASAKTRALVAREIIGESASAPNPRELWQTARRWFESAQALAPRDPYTSLHLAKCCLALGDEDCTARNLARTLENAPRLTSTALRELATIPLDKIPLPATPSARDALTESLLAQGRHDDAQRLCSRLAAAEAASCRCRIYHSLGIDEACDLEIDALHDDATSLPTLALKVDSLVRSRACAPLFELLQSREAAFADAPAYWEKRLQTTAFHGKCMGEAWYRDEMQRMLLVYRQKMDGTSRMQFVYLLCDAQFALEKGQYPRAERSAAMALKLRPGHPAATSIRDTAERMQER